MCLIMSSWGELHNFYTNMYSTVVVGQADILSKASDVSGRFSLS